MFKSFQRRLVSLIFALAGIASAQSPVPKKDVSTIAKAARGAIVTIVMAHDDESIARGTGFLVKPDGTIVTDYHVIASGNAAVAKFADGTILPVDGVLATDKVRDLAIIKIHGKNFPTLALGNSNQLQVGDEVVAIDNPLGLELTVSNGILSGVRTDEKETGELLQITAPMSHGSSGGPLFNMFGEVIGINSGYLGENLNFAIPVNDAKSLLSNTLAKLQDLPNEPFSDAQDAKPAASGKPPEVSWLNTERFVTPAFSALFPRRQWGDGEVDCETEDRTRLGDNRKVIVTECWQLTEGAAVLVAYSDMPFELTSDDRASANSGLIRSSLVNPIVISTNQPASINQDQSLTVMPPIAALESTANGLWDGSPAKVCIRSGGQGHRQWLLIVTFTDATGHTQKDCDVFFDSVLLK